MPYGTGSAVDRTTMPQRTGGASDRFMQWATQQYQQNPTGYVLPPGTKIENGQVVDASHLLGDLLKQLALAGAGAAGLGAAGAAVGGGAAAGGFSPATGGFSAGVPSMATSGTVASGAGTAAAGAAAKGAGMAFGVKDAVGLLPSILSLFKKGGSTAPPQQDAMNSLIQMQTQRMQQADPLYQAILKMAMQLAPMSARSGMAPPAQPTAMPRNGVR